MKVKLPKVHYQLNSIIMKLQITGLGPSHYSGSKSDPVHALQSPFDQNARSISRDTRQADMLFQALRGVSLMLSDDILDLETVNLPANDCNLDCTQHQS